MDDPLIIYLTDHLAGSVHAIELLKNMREVHRGDPLGKVAADLLVDIDADRDVLQAVADRAGAASTGLKEVKEMMAWLGEKVSRLKLRDAPTNYLGILEALEFLELGIHGKLALWRALAAASSADSRLQGTDYEYLVARAEAQHHKVETKRLDAARVALRPVTK